MKSTHYQKWTTNSITLLSKEGVTQGDPLSMILYGIGVLQIIRSLEENHSKLIHLWYKDDAGIGGVINDINNWFQELKLIGPKYGYFPEPKK